MKKVTVTCEKMPVVFGSEHVVMIVLILHTEEQKYHGINGPKKDGEFCVGKVLSIFDEVTDITVTETNH
jgi:hypothetical protein